MSDSQNHNLGTNYAPQVRLTQIKLELAQQNSSPITKGNHFQIIKSMLHSTIIIYQIIPHLQRILLIVFILHYKYPSNTEFSVSK